MITQMINYGEPSFEPGKARELGPRASLCSRFLLIMRVSKVRQRGLE